MFLGNGDDVFFDNTQTGDAGRDTVSAGFGNDTIDGGGGADLFFGGAGDDVVLGRLGNDTLLGGAGSDTLTGAGGVDTFEFQAADATTGTDEVTDFELGTDVLRLGGTMSATVDYNAMTNQVTISVGADVVTTLDSIDDLSGFGSSDIVFF